MTNKLCYVIENPCTELCMTFFLSPHESTELWKCKGNVYSVGTFQWHLVHCTWKFGPGGPVRQKSVTMRRPCPKFYTRLSRIAMYGKNIPFLGIFHREISERYPFQGYIFLNHPVLVFCRNFGSIGPIFEIQPLQVLLLHFKHPFWPKMAYLIP